MQVYIDGLSDDVTNKDLALLANVASTESVRVIRDIVSGESRGFALVTITDITAGQEVIRKLNGTLYKERKLTAFRIHDTLPGEMEFREWLRDNAADALRNAGTKQSQTVVDYGCGPGIFSLEAAEIVGRSGKVYALDVRPRALEEIKKSTNERGLTNLETMLIDRLSPSVTLGDESADIVLLYDVLQEVTDKTGLLKELHRIMKPTGVLSVFPMHLGTANLLDLVDAVGLFQVRDRYNYPGWESASEVINLTKRKR